MKIRTMSDLHLEFGEFTPTPMDADVLVLAGDIHMKLRAMKWIETHFPDVPVIYVPGNHEYYGSKFLGHFLKLKEAAPKNVHVMDRDEIVIGGIRFLGTTLWTDFNLAWNQPLAMWDAQQSINDYKKITFGASGRYRKLRPADLLAEHALSLSWLRKQLAQPFEGTTVVVTHHAPSELSIPEFYQDNRDNLNGAYASRLEHLFSESVPVWVHGHMHSTLDYELAGTRVLCNPRGYFPDSVNPDFRDDFVIDLPDTRDPLWEQNHTV